MVAISLRFCSMSLLILTTLSLISFCFCSIAAWAWSRLSCTPAKSFLATAMSLLRASTLAELAVLAVLISSCTFATSERILAASLEALATACWILLIASLAPALTSAIALAIALTEALVTFALATAASAVLTALSAADLAGATTL